MIFLYHPNLNGRFTHSINMNLCESEKVKQSKASKQVCVFLNWVKSFIVSISRNKPKGVCEVAIAEIVDAKNNRVLILQGLKYKLRGILVGPLQSSLQQEWYQLLKGFWNCLSSIVEL